MTAEYELTASFALLVTLYTHDLQPTFHGGLLGHDLGRRGRDCPCVLTGLALPAFSHLVERSSHGRIGVVRTIVVVFQRYFSHSLIVFFSFFSSLFFSMR